MDFDSIVLPAHANPIVLEWISSGKVEIRLNGCWEWVKGKSKGYGKLSFKGKMVRANRLAINCADAMHAAHSCDNPSCVNPSHIREDTREGNMRDTRGKKGKNGQCHCGRAAHPTCSGRCPRCSCREGFEAYDLKNAAKSKAWRALKKSIKQSGSEKQELSND